MGRVQISSVSHLPDAYRDEHKIIFGFLWSSSTKLSNIISVHVYFSGFHSFLPWSLINFWKMWGKKARVLSFKAFGNTTRGQYELMTRVFFIMYEDFCLPPHLCKSYLLYHFFTSCFCCLSFWFKSEMVFIQWRHLASPVPRSLSRQWLNPQLSSLWSSPPPLNLQSLKPGE